mgnify:CR=1 FL=1
MPLNHEIRVRVSKTQLDRIRQTAEAKGHSSISSLIRDELLKPTTTMEDQIREIHRKIVGYDVPSASYGLKANGASSNDSYRSRSTHYDAFQNYGVDEYETV